MKYAIIGSGEILSGPISKSEILMKDSACERTLRLHFFRPSARHVSSNRLQIPDNRLGPEW
jgi:hypothetical protein